MCHCFLSVSTSSKHKQQLERQLDMAKRSAQAEINQLKKELKEMKQKQPTGNNNYFV